MGFFSDLKEDLSQAVNELMPEETEGSAAAAETLSENSQAQSEEFGNIDEMLERVDSIVVPEVTEEMPETVERTVDTALEENLAADESAAAPVLEEKQEIKKETRGETKVAEMINARVAADETSSIMAGMTINGDVICEGSLDLIGCVNGNIDILGKLNVTGYITGNSKAAEIYADNAKITGEIVSEGAVKICSSSVVIGNISASSAAIAGAVKGDIDVHGPVILDASAIVMGNIKSKSVQINNGAVIEGMCSQCYADVNPTSFFDEYKPEVKKGRK